LIDEIETCIFPHAVEYIAVTLTLHFYIQRRYNSKSISSMPDKKDAQQRLIANSTSAIQTYLTDRNLVALL